MANTAEFRENRKAERVEVPAGKMPPNWDDWSAAGMLCFTQAERAELLSESYLWAPSAPPEAHGTYNGYNNYFCRCPKDRRGNTDSKFQARQNGIPGQ